MNRAAGLQRLVDHLQETAHVVFDVSMDEATRRAAEETARLMLELEDAVLAPHEGPAAPAARG